MQTGQKPLILTLQLDTVSQVFFDQQRELYFPPQRNFLKAHLTLFHQLPDKPDTRQYLSAFRSRHFDISVNGLRHLGAGVAYSLESAELQELRREMSRHFKDYLIPQDSQPFKPHITIQNKVSPEVSRRLLAELSKTFVPFTVQAVGLELWAYLDGPWQHEKTYAFPLLTVS